MTSSTTKPAGVGGSPTRKIKHPQAACKLLALPSAVVESWQFPEI